MVGLLLMPYNPQMMSKVNFTSRMNLKPNSPNTLGSGGKETKNYSETFCISSGEIYLLNKIKSAFCIIRDL